MVLELTTVAEGLHRRLRPDDVRFSETEAADIRRAAVEAAARITSRAREPVEGLLRYLHEPGYRRRLNDLAQMAEPLAPGVSGHTARWKEIVFAARNEYAHRVDHGWLNDDDIDRYITVAFSLRWLLRALLLGQAAIPSERLASRFMSHEPYQLFLEQAKQWQPKVY
jgi:hypothetical protein